MLLGKRLVGQFQLIITVLDIKRLDKYNVYVQYTGAIIELLQPLNHKLLHLIYGIVKVKRWSRLNRQVLRNGYFYLMPSILQSAHIILAATSHPDLYYINNYINWDQYNTLYLDNFLKKGTCIILLYKNQNK